MNIPTHMPRLKGFRYPSEIIAYAVLTYHGFALSTTDVEDHLAERGVIVSREAVRLWVNRFGTFRKLHPAGSPTTKQQVAYRRSPDCDPGQEELALACNRREWRRTRHSRANTPQRQSRNALFQKIGRRVRRTEGGDRR